MRSFPVLAALTVSFVTATGCDTVDVGEPPADLNACRPDPSYFINKVWPEFLAKSHGGKRCGDSGCHDASSGRPLLVVAPTSAARLPLPPDWSALYLSVSEQVQCTNVGESPLITRPDGRTTHGGGKLIEVDGPEAQLVKAWVNAK